MPFSDDQEQALLPCGMRLATATFIGYDARTNP
jgi:hypothetical protein